MNSQIVDIVEKLDPITLDQMDNIQLMDRIDRKYFFEEDKLLSFLAEIGSFYKVLEIENKRFCTYSTLYYDTPDFSLYHKHHNQRLNRNKIRKRIYVDNGASYFEIKYKNNKNRTIKDRIKYRSDNGLIEREAKQFLHDQTGLLPEQLIPVLDVSFLRCTLVNRNDPERVTIDFSLQFDFQGKSKSIDRLVIVEAKQNKNVQSPFIRLLKDNHIIQGSISKYCLGMALLNENLKKNNFKSRILRINKLLYGIASGY